jgi:hypothetical protein
MAVTQESECRIIHTIKQTTSNPISISYDTQLLHLCRPTVFSITYSIILPLHQLSLPSLIRKTHLAIL